MYRFIIIIFLLIQTQVSHAQVLFTREIPVTIIGLPADAMEPFISPDDQILFYNSLNDGVNTSLFYATRINDSTFQHQGVILNVNNPAPHLDAVASCDVLGNFVWVSTRDYPTLYENLIMGHYANGVVTGITRLYGDFYIPVPGWLIMDAAVTFQGDKLIYCNAYFNNCNGGLPCKASLGIASKVNDSTFIKQSNSSSLFAAINDTAFLVYAPQLSQDGLELYYTRLQKNTIETQICLSVRSDTTQNFPPGIVMYSNTGAVPEAPTISADQTELFYHRKENGYFRIFMRKRELTAIQADLKSNIKIYPNPGNGIVKIEAPHLINSINISDQLGRSVYHSNKPAGPVIELDLSQLKNGIYSVQLDGENPQLIIVNH